WSAGHWCVWCSASFSRLACTTRRRFRAQANGWIDAENPRLARPLHRLSKARNSIRLVLDRSHLWSSRIRGVREILAHPGKKPMGHRGRSEFGGCQSKTAAQNNNEPPCPRRFLTQPTEFEKSGVLQHPLARRGNDNDSNDSAEGYISKNETAGRLALPGCSFLAGSAEARPSTWQRVN